MWNVFINGKIKHFGGGDINDYIWVLDWNGLLKSVFIPVFIFGFLSGMPLLPLVFMLYLFGKLLNSVYTNVFI